MKELNLLYTEDEIKAKEKDLISRLNINKIGYKEIKEKILKKGQKLKGNKLLNKEVDYYKTNESEGNNNTVNLIDFSIDIEKLDSN
jgi:hypothetical protein